MEPEVSLQCLQEPTTRPYSEQMNPVHIIFFNVPFNTDLPPATQFSYVGTVSLSVSNAISGGIVGHPSARKFSSLLALCRKSST
jgi:hypothetical protein